MRADHVYSVFFLDEDRVAVLIDRILVVNRSYVRRPLPCVVTEQNGKEFQERAHHRLVYPALPEKVLKRFVSDSYALLSV